MVKTIPVLQHFQNIYLLIINFIKEQSSKDFVNDIVELALEKRAENVISLEVDKISSITDYFIICSANTEPQVKAICDNIRKNTNYKPNHIEGYQKLNWVLLDYLDVIIHVFKSEHRKFYDFESLWADAPLEEFVDEKS